MIMRYVRSGTDHFEPEADFDPQTQRRLRGLLEKIDYTAFVSNKEVMAASLGTIAEPRIQRLAVAGAQARARWVHAALELADAGAPPGTEDIERLARLHLAFDELAAAYEALRRLVERGYVKLPAANAPEQGAA